MWPIKTITSLILLFSTLLLAHDFNYFSDLYKRKKFEELIENSIPLVAKGNASPQILSLVGRAYVEIGEAESAIPHLRIVVEAQEDIPKRMNAWSLYYLSKAYARIGNIDSAQYYLEKTIKSKATKNIVSAAKKYMIRLGISPVFKKWMNIETKNFIFHFHNKTKLKNLEQYAKDRQEAFDSINTFFDAELPKKIDFYVWNDFIEYSRKQKRNSGFAVPELSIVHTRYFQTRGHEMTHVISYYVNAESMRNRVSFINEGTATCFNLYNRNRIKMAKKARAETNVPIIEMWKNEKAFRGINQDNAYAIAGAFVSFLIEKEGREKFLKLLENQSIENAKEIYGNGLYEIIEEFEKTIKS